MDRDFAMLSEYITNGHDIIVPSPNMQDLYGQYEHNYWEQVHDERKQVIFHNIGTGLARIPFEYIKYIQTKFDILKEIGDSNGKIESGGGADDQAADVVEEKKDAAADDEAADANQGDDWVVVAEENAAEQKHEENKNAPKPESSNAPESVKTAENLNDGSEMAEVTDTQSSGSNMALSD